MKIFGIDPGSDRTGYGCIESSGSRHRLVTCGILSAPARSTFPEKLLAIHRGLKALLERHRPECVAIENIFYAKNVRSALKLGHARGVALLAASEAAIPVVEYSPAEIKRSVVGYGRAEKPQVQAMMKLLLGLDAAPSPHDVADALAVAICHIHTSTSGVGRVSRAGRSRGRSLVAALSALSSHCQHCQDCQDCQNSRATFGASPVRNARAFPQNVGNLGNLGNAMISRLSGQVAEKTPNRVIVDVGGVGYDVLVPLSTFYVLGEPGATVTLRIHTHVREDVIALYGFITRAGAGSLRTADRDQRDRPEAGARGPVRHRAGGADPRRADPGRREAHADSRRRKEDGGAHRPRAEGSAAGLAADARTGAGGIDTGRSAAR